MNNAFYSNKFYTKDSDLFRNLDTDIWKMAKALNNYTEKDQYGQLMYPIKRLLVNIEKNALYKVDECGFNFWDKYDYRYNANVVPLTKMRQEDEDNDLEVSNEAREIEKKTDLVDKLICRTPMIPSRDNSREMGSYISINMLEDDLTAGKNSSQTTIAIDTWTPPSQWVIDDGLRPYLLCSYIDKVMTNTFRQENGVKYRLVQVINAKLSDDLLGFRMVYESVLED